MSIDSTDRSRVNARSTAASRATSIPPCGQKVFSGDEIYHYKEVSRGRHDQVMVKTTPAAPLIMIQSQIVFASLKVLLDGPASPAQAQAPALSRGLPEPGDV